MSDKYKSFEELARYEKKQDYSIETADRGTRVLLMGPHAGNIEPGTSEVVLAIAGESLSYYLFEGLKLQDIWALHITSTKFDEPRALNMAGKSDAVITIHGERSERSVVYLGGLNQALKQAIKASLQQAGFVTDEHHDSGLHGVSPRNICNRSATNSGVQLELSKGLREKLFASLAPAGRKRSTEILAKLADAVREGLQGANAY